MQLMGAIDVVISAYHSTANDRTILSLEQCEFFLDTIGPVVSAIRRNLLSSPPGAEEYEDTGRTESIER